jgi:hypothetical protein
LTITGAAAKALERSQQAGAAADARRPAAALESEPMTPPRVATWLLETALPPAMGEAIAGDLYEEFCDYAVPCRGVFFARWWYRWQVARSLAPLFFRSWQRASVRRGSAAVIAAGLIPVLPATLLLTLRTFVLQQVPLKTTAELSLVFATSLAFLVALSALIGLVIAVRLLSDDQPRSR